MTGQIPLIDDGHAAKLERDREYELDRTPAAVCRQGLTWAIWTIRSAGADLPSTMIDIGAGSGVFGQQLNALAAMHAVVPYTIAIEPRMEEAPHLRRHYERMMLTTFGKWWHDAMPCDPGLGDFDPTRAWVACNPAFSIFPDIVRACAPVCVATLLYGSIAWGCSEAGADLFETHPPYACARVVGRVHHRGPGINPSTGQPWGADQRDNCWWLWLKDHAPDRWTTENLPLLPSEQRRWTIPPGQEP